MAPLTRFLKPTDEVPEAPKPATPKRARIEPTPPRPRLSTEAFHDLQGRILDLLEGGAALHCNAMRALVGGHRKDFGNAIGALERRRMIAVKDHLWSRIRKSKPSTAPGDSAAEIQDRHTRNEAMNTDPENTSSDKPADPPAENQAGNASGGETAPAPTDGAKPAE